MAKLPTKEVYVTFKKEFANKLARYPDVCFFTYGSADDEQRCDFGRSDVDGGLVIDSSIVTDKEKIKSLAHLLAQHLSHTNLRTQFNLIDTTSAADGRFLSYGITYTDFLKKKEIIHTSANFLCTCNGVNYKSEELHTAAFNFCGPAGVRNTLLYSEHSFSDDKKAYAKSVLKSIEKAAKFPKKLVFLQTGELIVSRRESLTALENLLLIDKFSDDLIFFDYLLKNPQKLHTLTTQKEKSIDILTKALNAVEHMLEGYIKKFPVHSDNEYKR